LKAFQDGRFQKILPQIAEMKQLVSDGEIICWEAYDGQASSSVMLLLKISLRQWLIFRV